ncbi:hypothetical protein [Paracoccus marcusii]|uniref:Uncharacterized protein n=1 Tax=Paracoccus marcusii TaxID=59779 RepID=A0ABY7UU29_9RHOB|nr:hypothetical protein [Paracoccus marcusii]WDA13440.1 hypothetical protein PRL19_04090 [Paracoccus marcusii]
MFFKQDRTEDLPPYAGALVKRGDRTWWVFHRARILADLDIRPEQFHPEEVRVHNDLLAFRVPIAFGMVLQSILRTGGRFDGSDSDLSILVKDAHPDMWLSWGSDPKAPVSERDSFRKEIKEREQAANSANMARRERLQSAFVKAFVMPIIYLLYTAFLIGTFMFLVRGNY